MLYLVRSGRWQKFGHGTRARVLAHNAEVVQVRRARHEDVIKAEAFLIERFRDHPHPEPGSAPVTFGAGREVVPVAVVIDLDEVLPAGDDITYLF